MRGATIALGILLAVASSAVAQPAASTRRVIRPASAPADRPYSPGVLVGKTLYISGQLGLPGSGATPADLTAQTRQAMDGIGAVLTAAGLGYEHLVKCHVYLANMDDYAAMNAAYGSYFTERVPARTTVQAAALPSKAGVQIGCIGYADLAGISVVRPPAGSLPAPLGPYSPAVWAGDTLYVSGMGGQDPATKVVGESVEAQVTQTVANITTTLKAAGLQAADIVHTQAYATRVTEAEALATALAASFGTIATPPGGLIAVPRLPGPIRAELTFVAVKATQPRTPLGLTDRLYAVKAGSTLYANAETHAKPGAGVEVQAQGAFAAMRGTLQDAGLTVRDVVSVTVYLSDLADMPAMNTVFREVFATDPPARVTIQVQPQGEERIRVGFVAAR